MHRILCALGLLVLAAVPAWQAIAQDTAQDTAKADAALTEAFLSDPGNIAQGKEIWAEQCKFCHGKTAYPGKAPKLKPYKYTPEFVYKRVTKGFRGMPAWGEVYDDHERMSVTAYVMSKGFTN